MDRFLDILRYILYYLRKALLTIGWVVSFLFFIILISGAVYYYMKPDLPPQEVWNLAYEFFPHQVSTLSDSQLAKNILPWIEIDYDFANKLAQQENLQNSLVGSGAYSGEVVLPEGHSAPDFLLDDILDSN